MSSTDRSGSRAWRALAHRIGARTEDVLERVTARFERRFRPDLPLHVVPFSGYGNRRQAFLKGRVLRYREPVTADPDTTWGALQHSYRRFATREVPDIEVRATCGGAIARDRSDEEGYFRVEFVPPADRDTLYAEVALDLPGHDDEYAPSKGRVLIPPDTAGFGVISDVDDTVLVTGATSLLHMMRLTLLESTSSRMAFPGVAAFYRALHDGRNPFFYVSSSPWNLHEFLEDFFAMKEVVPGPLLLRDLGIDEDKFIAGSHHDHKLGACRGVLDTYPDLPFVLVGDSGQHDAEIYAELVDDYPGRILAIYIRDVSNAVRDRKLQGLMRRTAAAGTEMLLVPDTLGAARHAAQIHLIDEASVEAVREDVERDLRPDNDV